MIHEQEGAHRSSPAGLPPEPMCLIIPGFISLRKLVVICGSGLRGPGATAPLAGAFSWFKVEKDRPLAPALARAGPAFALGWLETLSDFLRLLEVFGHGTPEEQASGNTSDRDGDIELCSHAEDAVFHRGGTCPLRNRDAGSGVVERLDFSLEGLIELRVHPGAPAHGAGFC
jgi:hypothetical protein